MFTRENTTETFDFDSARHQGREHLKEILSNAPLIVEALGQKATADSVGHLTHAIAQLPDEQLFSPDSAFFWRALRDFSRLREHRGLEDLFANACDAFPTALADFPPSQVPRLSEPRRFVLPRLGTAYRQERGERVCPVHGRSEHAKVAVVRSALTVLFEETENLLGDSVGSRPLSTSAADGSEGSFLRSIQGAKSKLLECGDKYSAFAATDVRWIFALRTPATPGAHSSSSLKHLSHAVFVSLRNGGSRELQEMLVAEAWLHEFAHTDLRIIEEAAGIYGEGAMERCYYSPWRPDVRHTYGLMHASYVFLRVATFYLSGSWRTQEEDERARTRLYWISRQLRIALAQLEAAPLTTSGVALLSWLTDGLDSLQTLVSRVEFIDRALAEHFDRWQEDSENAKLISPENAALVREILD